ncbi:MAG: hypothetical protein R3F61_28405 [Myxococcota bacterium]
MSNLSLFSVFALSALSACSPTGTVLLDGSRVRDLQAAAEAAKPGSHLELAPGAHIGGVTLPAGAWLDGPGATIVGSGVLIEGAGDLTVTGVELAGGTDDEGSALRVHGDLALDGVTVREAAGEVAVRVFGELDVANSTLLHDRTTVRVLVQTGRPPTLSIRDTEATGLLDIPADFVDLVGLTGSARAVSFGHAFLVQDSQIDQLELTGPTVHLAGVTVADTARIDTGEAIVLDVSGGRWVLAVDQLTATGWLAEEVSGHAGSAVLTEVLASWIELEGTRIEASSLTAETVLLDMASLDVRDVRAQMLELDGLGRADSILVDGPSPTVFLGALDVAAMVVRSTNAPVRLRLEGTLVRGLAVVEPPAVPKAASIDTTTFANVFNLTWHGGGASTFEDGGLPLWVFDSILSQASASAHISPVFQDSVVWHPDGVTGDVPGAIIADPQFVGPGDPHLALDSPYRDMGAFAGPTGAFVEALWSQL